MHELYKKNRPRTLDKIVGNEQTVASLKNMLARKTLPHTILFSGPSGCGKTTLTRILRTELGCSNMDWKEMNSSSFRGIDTVRDIARTMNLAPVAGPCRVYSLDEVHKLTNDAQNAALKMLEDTPSHIFFFLSTTDPQKLIKPILTRCCNMPVRLLTYAECLQLAKRVCKREEITISDDTLDELAAASQGSARTLLVLLDKIAYLPDADRKDAIADRLADENQAIELCRALLAKNTSWHKITDILKNLKQEPEQVRWSVLGYARAVLLGKGDANARAYFMIEAFREPFYESKEAGLIAACYEVLYGE